VIAEHEQVGREDLFRRERINVAQACTLMGVHRNTIRNWMRLGWIEYVRTPSGGVRIYADTLLKRDRCA
jgi:excisionase family DNA binding protein